LNRKLHLEGFDSKNVIEYYLDILRLIGIQPRISPMEIYSDEKSRQWAKQLIKSGKLVVGIAPCGGQAFGASAGLKRWPEDHFSSLINRMVDRFHPQIFLFAGVSEKVEMERILSKLNPEAMEATRGFANQLFEEIVALTGHCDLFISNDTGLLRVAVAYGKKTVSFFGPADERVYGPFPFDPARHRVLTHPMPCHPCYKRFRLSECHDNVACLRGISVEEALCACEELLLDFMP